MRKDKNKKMVNNCQGDEKLQKDEELKDGKMAQEEVVEGEEVIEITEAEVDNENDSNDLSKAKQAWLEEKEDLLDRIKRKQADLDNLRRISKNQQAETREYALQDFLKKLLPVIDNLERALHSARDDERIPEAHLKGMEMIHGQLVQLLAQEEVEVIESVGVHFDPNCHHAVLQVDDEDSEPGTVTEELQKGYRYRQRILRPSMVKVCKE